MSTVHPLRIGSWILVALVGLVAAGCGDSACEQLGEVCPDCPDATYRQSCENVVADEIDDVCATQKSTFQLACPPPAQ